MRKNVLVESDAGEHFNEGPALPQRARLDVASTFTVTSRKNHAHGIHEAQGSLSLMLTMRFLATGCGLPRVSRCLLDAQHSSKA